MLLKQHLYNPCLQNVQQSIEKGLKSLFLEKTDKYRKTHSITELVHLLAEIGIIIQLKDEDCDLLDAIYLPSKYPLGSILPDFDPDDALCRHCFGLAEIALVQVREALES